MKKQTYHIILLCTTIILFCLFFGKAIIHEGITGASESNIVLSDASAPNIPGAMNDLTDTTLLKTDVKNDKDIAEQEKKQAELAEQAAKVLKGKTEAELKKYTDDLTKVLKDIINSAFTPPVLYLPLVSDAKNYANKLSGVEDPTNTTTYTNKNIQGSTTTLEFTKKGNKPCIYFRNDPNHYLSFPVNFSRAFSFCVWIYVDTTDKTHQYTAVSLTNKKYMHPSVQVDIIDGNHVLTASSLPQNWTIWHDYHVKESGWVHITYTFSCDSEGNNVKVDMYANANNVGAPYKPSSAPLKLFQFERPLIKFFPDTFIIGRSGNTLQYYKGHIRQFIYYSMKLSQEQITDIYNYTNDV